MNVTFLGGANEIGGSSTSIEIEGQGILSDIGIRQNVETDKQLPDLDKIRKIDAFLLTHAHTDHIGALPGLVGRLPADVTGYCTPATKHITRVLLTDSKKRADRDKKEGKELLFTPEEIDAALKYLDRMEEVPWGEPVPICAGVTATWIPAGHILGASMIFIEGERESILITGDVSVTDQKAIPGMSLSNLPYQPDVMVMESTYGNGQHKNRAEEEARLVSDVAEVIEAGGKVLFPVFAIGRAQEVILVLKHAMQSGRIPEFPVYVDGMVRSINRVYSQFSDELAPDLQCRSQRAEDIFYSDSIREVSSRDERDMILSASQPCCIVASSGMLNGGASDEYAKALANYSKNLIAITGYQAEGTPGRALEDEKDFEKREKRSLALENKPPVPVLCDVKRYYLSAHADKHQLTELVKKVRPRKVFLVHGEQDARESLARSIQEACPCVEVTLPRNGKTYAVRHYTGIVGEQSLPLDMMLPMVLEFVATNGLKGPFCASDFAQMYYGTEATNPSHVASFLLCLWLKLGRPVTDRDMFYPQDLA